MPGVGRKTANVVLSVAFAEAAFAVDTHVFRVAHRLGLTLGKTPRAVEDDVVKLVPSEKLRLRAPLVDPARARVSARLPSRTATALSRCGSCARARRSSTAFCARKRARKRRGGTGAAQEALMRRSKR